MNVISQSAQLVLGSSSQFCPSGSTEHKHSTSSGGRRREDGRDSPTTGWLCDQKPSPIVLFKIILHSPLSPEIRSLYFFYNNTTYSYFYFLIYLSLPPIHKLHKGREHVCRVQLSVSQSLPSICLVPNKNLVNICWMNEWMSLWTHFSHLWIGGREYTIYVTGFLKYQMKSYI